MRISDWSSDVCSSDLAARNMQGLRSVGEIEDRAYAKLGEGVSPNGASRPRLPLTQLRPTGPRRARPEDQLGSLRDRKSAGWGKRVSVRVDLGGRRILQKKNKYH